MGDKIPNSTDLKAIADQMKAYSDQLPNLITVIGEMTKNMKPVTKIKWDEFKAGAESSVKMIKHIKTFVSGMSQAFGELGALKEIKLDSFNQIRDVLMSKEFSQDPEGRMDITDDKGNRTNFFKVTQPGLLDVFTQIAQIGSIMNSMVFVNPVKFNLKFKLTLHLFKKQYKELTSFTDAFKPEDIKLIKDAVDGLQEVMMFLPATVAGMAKMFTQYGKKKIQKHAELGAQVLLGKDFDGTGGLVFATLLLGEQLNSKVLDPNDIQAFAKSMKPLNKAIRGMIFTVSLAALAGPILRLGLAVLFGTKGKRGVLRAMITGLEWVAEKSKTIKDATKSLLYVSGAIAILGLTAAVMVLTGLVAIQGWQGIAATIAFVGILVLMFWIVGKAANSIHEGSKELLYIAATIGILALTAVVVVMLGQFINAEWDSVLQVGTMLGFLVLAFIGIGFMKKWINDGTKEMLWIALTVGILALIAVALVWVSNYVEGNWESIMQIGVMLGFLCGTFIAVGLLHKQLEQGQKAMILIMVFTVITALVVGLYALIANSYDMLATLEAVGIMILIIGAIGAACWAAGKLQAEIEEGIVAMAIIVGVSLLMSLVMKNLAEAASIADPLDILYVTGIMLGIVLAVGAIAFACASFVMGPQGIAFLAGVGAVATIGVLALELSAAVKNMAEAAMAIEESGYKDAEKLAEILKLPIKAIAGDGDDDEDSVLANIKKLPGSSDMSKYTYKVKLLQYITSSIGGMADTLQHIASLNMPDPDAGYDENGKPKGWKQMSSEDFAMASQNASVILGMTSAMFADEPTDFTLGDGSKFTTQVVNTSTLEKVGLMVQWKVGRLSAIVGHIGNMADTLQHIASLNMPDPDAGYDENGKPKGWKPMKAEEFTTASENAGSILTYFASLFADKPVPVTVLGKQIMVGARNDMLAGLDNISRSTRRKVERLGEIVTYVGNMAVTLQNISSLNMPDPDAGYDENGKPKGWKHIGDTEFTNASENVSKIITTLISTVSSPDLAKQLEDMDDDAAENFETIMGAMSGITGVTDLLKMLAGGEIPTAFMNDPETGERVPDPNSYINVTKWIEEHPDLSSTVKSMFDVVIKAVSPYNHGDDESMLHDAEDEIETLGEVITGIQAPVDTIMNIFKDHLNGDVNIYTIRIRWQELMSMVNDILTSIFWASVNDDKAEDIADIIDTLNEPINSLLDMYKDKMVEFDADKFKDYYKSIIKTPIETIAELGKTYKPDDLKEPLFSFGYIVKKIGQINIDDKSAQNYQTNVKETVGLIKEIGKVDLKKLQTADNLMAHISELSKSIRGDFRELARVLNEELLEALEKLIDIFENPPERGGGSSEDTPTLGDTAPENGGTEGQADKGKDNDKDNAMADVAKELKSLNKKLANLAKLTFDGEKLKVSSSMWS